MTSLRKVLKHSSYLLFARLFTRLASVPFLIYVAGTLGPSLFGVLAFVLATVEMLSSLGDFGLSRYGARAIIREKERQDRLAGIILSLELVFSLALTVLGLALIGLISPESPKSEVMLLGLAAVLLSSFIYATDTLFTARSMFGASALFSIVGKIVYLAAGFAALYLGFSVIAVMFAFVFGMAAESVLRMVYTVRRVSAFSFRFSRQEASLVALGTMPFAVTALSSIVYFRADAIILGLVRGDVDVGIYSAAYSFFIFFMWIPIVLMRVLLPGLTARFAENPAQAERESWFMYRLAGIASVPVCFVMTVMARPVITTFMSDAFDDSVIVLQIIMWAIPTLMMVSVGFNALTIYNQEKTGAKSSVFTAVLIVALDLALIPSLGAVGAAIAMVATTAIWAIQVHWLLQTRLFAPGRGALKSFGIPLVGGGAMAAAGLAVASSGRAAVLVAGAAAYGAVAAVWLLLERRFTAASE